MARLPVTLPADCGANETVNVTLWAAPRVSGTVTPLKPKPVPTGVIWLIVSGDPPELVRVSDSEVLLPVVTLPKLRLAGAAVSWPGVTPVPESGTFKGELVALEAMAKLPVMLPAAVGENFTLKLTLCPALSVAGRVRPLALNPEPVAVAAEIVTLDPPELVTVSVRDALLPVFTLEKLRLVGAAVS
jgi:hypothetical protein